MAAKGRIVSGALFVIARMPVTAPTDPEAEVVVSVAVNLDGRLL